MDNLPMPHGELLTLWTHNFGKISFPKKGDNKEIYSLQNAIKFITTKYPGEIMNTV